MSNLDKAKAIGAERKKTEQARKKLADGQARHQARAMKEATRLIRAEMKGYHNVKTPDGKLTWHPKLLELRMNKEIVMFIEVGWEREVCVWSDPDTGSFYDDLVRLTASRWKHGTEAFIKSHSTDSFLSSVADHMSKLL